MVTVNKVWTDEHAIYINTVDGKVYYELFDDYPRLRKATPQQRKQFITGRIGIRWDALDEDLSYDGFIKPNRMLTT